MTSTHTSVSTEPAEVEAGGCCRFSGINVRKTAAVV